MSKTSSILLRYLKTYVAPDVERLGFAYDGKLTFRRVSDESGAVRLIDFQLGTSFMQGKFTVNLGVYHPDFFFDDGDPPSLLDVREFSCMHEFRNRLGCVMETPLTLFVLRLFGPRRRWWQEILAPRDKWWAVCDDEDAMKLTLGRIVEAIKRFALPWLEARDDEELMRSCWKKIRHRLEVSREGFSN